MTSWSKNSQCFPSRRLIRNTEMPYLKKKLHFAFEFFKTIYSRLKFYGIRSIRTVVWAAIISLFQRTHWLLHTNWSVGTWIYCNFWNCSTFTVSYILYFLFIWWRVQLQWKFNKFYLMKTVNTRSSFYKFNRITWFFMFQSGFQHENIKLRLQSVLEVLIYFEQPSCNLGSSSILWIT